MQKFSGEGLADKGKERTGNETDRSGSRQQHEQAGHLKQNAAACFLCNLFKLGSKIRIKYPYARTNRYDRLNEKVLP